MRKVLIIWLWWQGKKYINYFLKNSYLVSWICKTKETKQKIEREYSIEVSLDYKEVLYDNFDIIVLSLPPKIQWEIALYILKNWFKNKLLIEIPVTWNFNELEKINKYKNVFFFLEEYYTLMAQFLRKIDTKEIKRIHINIISNKQDYINLEARKVSYIHINNNFLWININLNKDIYNFEFHNSSDIFYEIYIEYNKTKIIYVFNKEKYLKIWAKKYIDNYNFDNILKKILEDSKLYNKYYLEQMKIINKIID